VKHISNYENIKEEDIYKDVDEALYETKKLIKNMLIEKNIS